MSLLRVLLIDDEEELISAMAERLELRGIEVETCTSGEQALRRLQKCPFTVAVVDVKMPGLGGLKLLDEIHSRCPKIAIILFTGHASVKDAEEGIEQGAFDYLLKPINIDELVEKIKRAAAGTTEQEQASR